MTAQEEARFPIYEASRIDGARYATVSGMAHWDSLAWLSTSNAAGWVSPLVRMQVGDEYPVLWIASSSLVVEEAAVERLPTLLEAGVDFRPLNVEGSLSRFVIAVVPCIEVLVRERSEIEYFPDGTGAIMSFGRLAFDAAEIGGSIAFKIVGPRVSSVYFRQEAVDELSGLGHEVGVRFRLAGVAV